MGEILGLGVTHHTSIAQADENMTMALKLTLRDPGLPEPYRDPRNWPAQMREEWGEDQGRTAARAHKALLVENFRRIRRELDEFGPDFIVIWGDDQYENFREDIIPAFCVMAYDEIRSPAPWHEPYFHGPNAWNEPDDHQFVFPGDRAAAKYLATQLLRDGIDVAYCYQPLHHPLGHAFLLTMLYLDWDRKGHHKVVPFQINCYGRQVVSQHGGLPDLTKHIAPQDADPPSPSPRRCMQMGAAVARALKKSPWRVALIASSSWSHAFLSARTHWIYPDREADRYLFDAMERGDYERWRNYSLEEVEQSGQQEVLNWCALMGAMEEIGRRQPDYSTIVESWVFNSAKIFSLYRP